MKKPCKPWTGGTILPAGYGQVYLGIINGKQIRELAHRWVWEQEHGPIPPGMVIMHLCDNPPCVEITHLRLGTQADNFRDSMAKGRNFYMSKTHCKHGHEFTPENTYWRPDRPGQRHCRECARERDRRRSPRKRKPTL